MDERRRTTSSRAFVPLDRLPYPALTPVNLLLDFHDLLHHPKKKTQRVCLSKEKDHLASRRIRIHQASPYAPTTTTTTNGTFTPKKTKPKQWNRKPWTTPEEEDHNESSFNLHEWQEDTQQLLAQYQPIVGHKRQKIQDPSPRIRSSKLSCIQTNPVNNPVVKLSSLETQQLKLHHYLASITSTTLNTTMNIEPSPEMTQQIQKHFVKALDDSEKAQQTKEEDGGFWTDATLSPLAAPHDALSVFGAEDDNDCTGTGDRRLTFRAKVVESSQDQVLIESRRKVQQVLEEEEDHQEDGSVENIKSTTVKLQIIGVCIQIYTHVQVYIQTFSY